MAPVLFGHKGGSISIADAAGCADYDVSFARGTGEAPGVGSVGMAFTDALKARAGGKSVVVYPVEYPANLDPSLLQAGSAANDLSAHLQRVAATCPSTKFVLGGYSQGAAVVDMLLSDHPTRDTFSDTLPQGFDEKIVAVALFGNPAAGRLRPGDLDLSIKQELLGKVIDLCNPGDIACDPAGGSLDGHVTYGTDGAADHAAQFVSQRL